VKAEEKGRKKTKNERGKEVERKTQKGNTRGRNKPGRMNGGKGWTGRKKT